MYCEIYKSIKTIYIPSIGLEKKDKKGQKFHIFSKNCQGVYVMKEPGPSERGWAGRTKIRGQSGRVCGLSARVMR